MTLANNDNSDNKVMSETPSAPPILIIQETKKVKIQNDIINDDDDKDTFASSKHSKSSNGKQLDMNNNTTRNFLTSTTTTTMEQEQDQDGTNKEISNTERNQFSTRTNELIRMLVRHKQQIDVQNNFNVKVSSKGSGDRSGSVHTLSGRGGSGGRQSVDENFFARDEFARTTSMVSTGPGEVQAMSKRYKMVTSSVLWFCYFALVR